MDYDNDGTLDFISGSYDPGDLYLFRGLGKGQYAAVEQILDKAGQPVVHHPKEFAEYEKLRDDPDADPDESIQARVASFGSWAAPVDWDADGDLDLLMGSFAGDLFLRINEGTRERPVYGTESIPVEAAGEPLHVNMHANPVVADWNDDGLWDLIVGAGDGSVGWFENSGRTSQPKFGAYRQLVSPAAESKFFEQILSAGEQPAHGTRAQICVTDYNLDGHLDLIVGDYSDAIHRLRNLDESEQAEFDELRELQARFTTWAVAFREKYYADPESEDLRKRMETFRKDYELLEKKKSAFFEGEGRRTSYVWLFLRKTAAADQSATAATTTAGTAPAGNAAARQRVSVKAFISPIDGAEDEVMLNVELQPGWHLYSELPETSPFRTTTITAALPDGIHAVSEWQAPPALPSLSDPRSRIYIGLAHFTQRVRVEPSDTDRPIQIQVDFQVCNKDYCLPAEVLRETIPVAAAKEPE